MFNKIGFRLLVALLVLPMISIPIVGRAQSTYRVHIDYIDTERFPVVDAYVSVVDSQGFLVRGLLNSDFAVVEDGLSVPGFTLSPIQNTKQPLVFMLVIDASSSMNHQPLPTPLQQSIDASKDFAKLLQPQDLVGVLAFSDTPASISPFTTDRNALSASLDNIRPGNKAAMFDALMNAIDLLKDRSERPVIVLISNGKDTRSRATAGQVITDANKAGVEIYPIGLGNDVGIEQLRNLASETGGLEFIQPSPNALKAAFDNILQAVRQQYLLEYTSGLTADQLKHSLKLQATVQGLPVSATEDFIAKAGQVQVALKYRDGQLVGGDVNLDPDVVAPANLQQMQITVDGNPLTTVTSPQAMKYTWDSTTAVPGTHLVAVTITDKSGNSGTARVNLNVQPAVTVKIISPLDGASIYGLTKIAAQATTPSGNPVASLQIAIDGVAQPPLSAPPYEETWDTSLIAGGQHKILVTAFDEHGHPGKAEITVFVTVPTPPWWAMVLGVLILGAIVIPLASRSRKQRARGVTPSSSIKAGSAQLYELSGENPNHIWSLGTSEVRLGRKRDENDIPLAGRNASRQHAVIRYERGQYVIVALKPVNPVIVNNHSETQHVLQPGDVIRLGETTLRYEKG